MELPSRLPSPWTNDSSPLPSPCPPPSPAAWVQREWAPITRKYPTHTHTPIPLTPSQQDMHPSLRPSMRLSLSPSEEFLRNIQSHPMIIQRDGDQLRTPSPASSLELVLHDKQVIPSGPVPFPMSSRFTSPYLCASPRPLPGIGGSQHSLHSFSSSSADSTPARTPDVFANVPPPPPLPMPSLVRNSARVQKKQSQVRSSNTGAPPRPRLPALRASSISAPLGDRPQSVDSKSSRHPLYYMQDVMIVLKVEGSLYKVHRYLLEHQSDFFSDLMSDKGDALGHTDDQPIPLPENITRQAFDCLLSFLYTGIYDPASIPLADWVTLLRISTHLQFTKVRQYAVRELTARRASLPAVDAIVLAREHGIPTWLGPAYADLVRCAAPLDDDEAERLGARATAQVGRAREMLRADVHALHQQRMYGTSHAPVEPPDEQLVVRVVGEVFKL